MITMRCCFSHHSKLHVRQGVGPATASAILTAYCEDVPFMSDEAMAAALTCGSPSSNHETAYETAICVHNTHPQICLWDPN